MHGRTRRRLLIAVVTVLGIGFSDVIVGVGQALLEYLRPTTVLDPAQIIGLPPGCIRTESPPPDALMQFVEKQEELHHLSLQRVVVCQSNDAIPGLDRRFLGLMSSESFRSQWRPLPGVCCSCQRRRNVIMEVTQTSNQGSVVVQAALTQARWNYLLLESSAVRHSWVWRWGRSGCKVMVELLRRGLSGSSPH
jgi:hypothetical protein